jgi:hypothetical protein
MYRPEKGNDFRMLDRNIAEQFQVGGTDVYVHKYVGPVDPVSGEATPATPVNGNPIPELGIQDVLFMENRDRKYDPDVFIMRGIYTMQDIDFNLMQFGFFLSNDNVMITFHLKNTVETLGRKLMIGDVLELPHLRDEYALNDSMTALRKFYVVSEINRAATGYSQTWYPHLLRAKCEPLVNAQEYAQILNQEVSADPNTGIPTGVPDGTTLADVFSLYNKNIEVNNQIIAQAEADAPLSGYDTNHLYVLPVTDSQQSLALEDASNEERDASQDDQSVDASSVYVNPEKNMYVGYLTSDGIPANGAPYTSGIDFPSSPYKGAFCLRIDYMPNRLFRFDGQNWVYQESNVRMTMTNKPKDGKPDNNANTRQTQIGSFINNNATSTINSKQVVERQSLSKALKTNKPRADN